MRRAPEGRRSGGPLLAAASLACGLLLASCAADAHSRGDDAARVPQQTAAKSESSEPQEAVAATFTGLASWYGPRFHGRLTASGETFDMASLTAAHPHLPFGSRVRVTNLANGRSVVVTINDRGPYVKPRIIDLSHAAARRLGFVDDGLAKVRLEVLDPPTG
ncbi:MAG: septal ring lytic transglycosylase RlpA family protein [Kiloniellaceae bacterium]